MTRSSPIDFPAFTYVAVLLFYAASFLCPPFFGATAPFRVVTISGDLNQRHRSFG